jgi:hypothetical protein
MGRSVLLGKRSRRLSVDRRIRTARKVRVMHRERTVNNLEARFFMKSERSASDSSGNGARGDRGEDEKGYETGRMSGEFKGNIHHLLSKMETMNVLHNSLLKPKGTVTFTVR